MGATNPAAMRQACHLQTASVTLCNQDLSVRLKVKLLGISCGLLYVLQTQ